MVNQFMHAPHKPHWEVVCCIVQYLIVTANKGLLTYMIVNGFSNADLAVIFVNVLILVIVRLSVIILLLDTVRNKMWLHGLVRKLNIMP